MVSPVIKLSDIQNVNENLEILPTFWAASAIIQLLLNQITLENKGSPAPGKGTNHYIHFLTVDVRVIIQKNGNMHTL